MVVILLRTLLIYICLLGAMRLMGKRQIGQLDLTDLVSTLLISEIASLPIENPDIPIVYAIIPITTLVTFEIVSSTILARSPKFKNLLSSRPGFLIRDGSLVQKEISKNRISLDELMSELRRQGVNDISQIKYAILEQDGQISIILKSEYNPLSPSDLNINVSDDGIAHIIIANGVINAHGLEFIGKNRDWLERQLEKNKCRASDVFLMTVNDSGKINLTKKE